MSSSWFSNLNAASLMQAAQGSLTELQEKAMEAAEKAAKEAARLGQEAQASLMEDAGQKGGRREFSFKEGALGFELEGTHVISVDPQGQAHQLGICVGDRLVSIAGFAIPKEPREGAVAKWLDEMVRPGRVVFVQEGAGKKTAEEKDEVKIEEAESKAAEQEEARTQGAEEENGKAAEENEDLEALQSEKQSQDNSPNVQQSDKHNQNVEEQGWDDFGGFSDDEDAQEAVAAGKPGEEFFHTEAVSDGHIQVDTPKQGDSQSIAQDMPAASDSFDDALSAEISLVEQSADKNTPTGQSATVIDGVADGKSSDEMIDGSFSADLDGQSTTLQAAEREEARRQAA
eukprot:TRINITY_DN1721_c2_g1_i1.p1 TRINITY_DN1721_c2_g1~~TRINITY_DN1721_c2_g1_i1.p1  ORF type:complete len:343 (+),score=98.45 TRINITY_DN1721_c2_g1_i1:49-1077(+)